MKNFWAKRNIMGYLSYPDKNYSPIRQNHRKELRRMDEETKKDGAVVDWNDILNDFM